MNKSTPLNHIHKKFRQVLTRKYLLRIIILIISGLLTSMAIAGIDGGILSESNGDGVATIHELYQKMSWRNSEHALLENPIVISVDRCSRSQVGELLEILSESDAACIALDVVYSEINLSDSVLLDGLMAVSPRLIWAYVNEDIPSNSFFENELMDLSEPGDVSLNVESFSTPVEYIPIYDEMSVTPIDAVIARRIAPDAYDIWEQRSKAGQKSPIMFSLGEVEILSADDIFTNPSILNELDGRAVIIGMTESVDDFHPTIVNHNMPGVLIHAFSVATILSCTYPEDMPLWISWTIGGLFAILTLWVIGKIDGQPYSNLVGRILPIAILILMTYIAYQIFVKFNYLIDMSPILLFPTAVMLVYDIMFGIGGLRKWLIKKMRHAKNHSDAA